MPNRIKRYQSGGDARSQDQAQESDVTFFVNSAALPGTPEHQKLQADTIGAIRKMDDVSVMATASRMTGLPFKSPTQARVTLEKLIGKGVSLSAGLFGMGDVLPDRMVGYDVGAKFPALGGQMSVGATIPRGQGSPAFNLGYRREFNSGGKVTRGDGIAQRGKTKGRLV